MSKDTQHAHEKKHPAEQHREDLKQTLSALKANVSVHPVMAFLESFDRFFKKKKQVLHDGEILFSPGENPYLYIVTSGALTIFRFTATGDKKEIGKAYAGSFLGEGILFGRNQKDTEAISATDGTGVIGLTKEELALLESENPLKVLEMYKYIIEVTNGRLLDTGKELATMYEITKRINELSRLGEAGFKNIVDELTPILDADYIIYVEQHPVVKDLLVYKYNSRFPSIRSVGQKVGKELTTESKKVLENGSEILGTAPGDQVYALPLKSRDLLKGFLLICNKKKHADQPLRIAKNIAPLLASIIDNNQTLADKKAMEMKQVSY